VGEVADFEYELLRNLWRHPETNVVIYAEWMPWELIPITRS
jgi:hypothetical protein